MAVRLIICLVRIPLWNLKPGWVGILQVEQKITIKSNKQGEEGKKRENNGFKRAKHKKARSVAFFLVFCGYLCVWLSQMPCETPNSYKNADSSLVITFHFSACVSLLTPSLRITNVLGPCHLYLRSWTLTKVHVGSHGHISLSFFGAKTTHQQFTQKNLSCQSDAVQKRWW